MEVTSADPFASKQRTDLKKVAKHYPKAGEDGETWQVSHCYGTTIGGRNLGAGTGSAHRGGDSLYPTSSSDKIREEAESTKMRIVYDCSAKQTHRHCH